MACAAGIPKTNTKTKNRMAEREDAIAVAKTMTKLAFQFRYFPSLQIILRPTSNVHKLDLLSSSSIGAFDAERLELTI